MYNPFLFSFLPFLFPPLLPLSSPTSSSSSSSSYYSSSPTFLSFSQGSNQRALIMNNLGNPVALAVDWQTRKLYWTDNGLMRIEVSNLDGSQRRILVSSGLSMPRDLAIHPTAGWVWEEENVPLNCNVQSEDVAWFRVIILQFRKCLHIMWWISMKENTVYVLIWRNCFHEIFGMVYANICSCIHLSAHLIPLCTPCAHLSGICSGQTGGLVL